LQNLNFLDYLGRITSILSIVLFGSFLLLTSSRTAAQPADNSKLLPPSIGENWRAVGSEKKLNPDEWAILPNADVYAEYGLQILANRSYTDGERKINLEVFEMKFASGAYGLYTYNQGSFGANRREIYSGRYLFSISTDKDDLTGANIDQTLIEYLKKLPLDTAGEHPYLQLHLPEENKIEGSERYLFGPIVLSQLKNFVHLKDQINFMGGTEVVTADYRNGAGRMNLLIIEYHTPQSATEGLAKVTAQSNSLPQEEKDRQIIKRIGNYVVNAVNIQDLNAAQKTVSQIKYTKKLIWEGTKYTDIPLQFRPPDPAAVMEAKRTIYIVVRSLYTVALLMTGTIFMGVIVGTSYFYLRRYRRRKLGLDEIFGDSSIRLNLDLDDYLLDSEDSTIKRLGSGKG